MSYCLMASCLAHRREVFWRPPWSCWVHVAGCQPCEALAGEPDPTELHCRYCRARVQGDGAGRLWEYTDGSWSDKCPVSPTFRHEVTALGQRSLHASQADR